MRSTNLPQCNEAAVDDAYDVQNNTSCLGASQDVLSRDGVRTNIRL